MMLYFDVSHIELDPRGDSISTNGWSNRVWWFGEAIFPEKKALLLEEGQRSSRLASWIAALGETYAEDQPTEELQKFRAGGIGHCSKA
jgi:hypothetical protein